MKYYLEQCLKSIFQATETIETEIFVVDNASNDGSVEYIKKQFSATEYPKLHIIENKDNKGFGKANNQAVEQAKGEYILFLNPDTIVSREAICQTIAFMDCTNRVGAVGVKMLNADGSFANESRRGIPTPWTSFCKICGLTRCFPKSKIFGRYYLQYLSVDEICKIDIVSGAFMMISHKVINQTGCFDKDFFMYGEDIDLSYRILKEGFQNYFLPYPILHYKGESTKRYSYKYVNAFYEAMQIFFKKHFRKSVFFLRFFINSAIYFLAFIALINRKIIHLFYITHQIKSESSYNYLFIGSENTLNEAKEMVNTNKMNAQYVNSKKKDDIKQNIQNTDVVVFDLESMTYSELFDILQKDCFGKTIATFYPTKKLLITPFSIFNQIP